MKNIILIGASRAGKSTLTRMLSKRFDNLMLIRTDLLRLAFREAILKDNKINITTLKNDPLYINYVLSYYKYANKYDRGFLKIVDTVDFDPSDAKFFDNSIMICLGYPNVSADEVVNNWKKYDTDLDWTKGQPDELLYKYANREIENSKRLQEECNRCGVSFVDTSYDRNDVLNNAFEYITHAIMSDESEHTEDNSKTNIKA